MVSPLPVRGIDGHLVWGTDGAVWACFEVEPFPYPHRSVGDAREVHARTVGALLCLPGQSLILSVARSLSRDELEQRIRGGVDPRRAPGWAGMACRTAGRFVSEPVYQRLWFLVVRLADAGGGRQVVDRIRAAASQMGSVFGTPSPPPGRSRIAAAISEAEVLTEQLSQHLRLRRLDAYQVRWLYQRAGTAWFRRTGPPRRRERDRSAVGGPPGP